MPQWLHVLSIVSLLVAAACAVWCVLDLRRRPQMMAVMNAVWPLSMLFAGPIGLWLYLRLGRQPVKGEGSHDHGGDAPYPAAVAKGTLHCGAGCTLGDIIAEWLAVAFPVIAVWFGYGSLFGDEIFAIWIFDFILAFAIGIVFQYFAIVPMRDLSPGQGIVAAIKADTLSLTSWQVGMYGFMALAHFYIFGQVIGTELKVPSVEFWFMMQIAMLCGFVTAYPVNWWLIRAGLKERM